MFAPRSNNIHTFAYYIASNLDKDDILLKEVLDECKKFINGDINIYRIKSEIFDYVNCLSNSDRYYISEIDLHNITQEDKEEIVKMLRDHKYRSRKYKIKQIITAIKK